MADVAAGEFGDVGECLGWQCPVFGDECADVVGGGCRDVVDDESGLEAIDELIGAAVGGADDGGGGWQVVQECQESYLGCLAHLVHFFDLGHAVAWNEAALAVAVGQCFGYLDVNVGAVEFVDRPLGCLQHGVDQPFCDGAFADARPPEEHDFQGRIAVVLAEFNLALQEFGHFAGLPDEVGWLVGGVL